MSTTDKLAQEWSLGVDPTGANAILTTPPSNFPPGGTLGSAKIGVATLAGNTPEFGESATTTAASPSNRIGALTELQFALVFVICFLLLLCCFCCILVRLRWCFKRVKGSRKGVAADNDNTDVEGGKVSDEEAKRELLSDECGVAVVDVDATVEPATSRDVIDTIKEEDGAEEDTGTKKTPLKSATVGDDEEEDDERERRPLLVDVPGPQKVPVPALRSSAASTAAETVMVEINQERQEKRTSKREEARVNSTDECHERSDYVVREFSSASVLEETAKSRTTAAATTTQLASQLHDKNMTHIFASHETHGGFTQSDDNLTNNSSTQQTYAYGNQKEYSANASAPHANNQQPPDLMRFGSSTDAAPEEEPPPVLPPKKSAAKTSASSEEEASWRENRPIVAVDVVHDEPSVDPSAGVSCENVNLPMFSCDRDDDEENAAAHHSRLEPLDIQITIQEASFQATSDSEDDEHLKRQSLQSEEADLALEKEDGGRAEESDLMMMSEDGDVIDDRDMLRETMKMISEVQEVVQARDVGPADDYNSDDDIDGDPRLNANRWMRMEDEADGKEEGINVDPAELANTDLRHNYLTREEEDDVEVASTALGSQSGFLPTGGEGNYADENVDDGGMPFTHDLLPPQVPDNEPHDGDENCGVSPILALPDELHDSLPIAKNEYPNPETVGQPAFDPYHSGDKDRHSAYVASEDAADDADDSYGGDGFREKPPSSLPTPPPDSPTGLPVNMPPPLPPDQPPPTLPGDWATSPGKVGVVDGGVTDFVYEHPQQSDNNCMPEENGIRRPEDEFL